MPLSRWLIAAFESVELARIFLVGCTPMLIFDTGCQDSRRALKQVAVYSDW
jgi:hypothetical protein